MFLSGMPHNLPRVWMNDRQHKDVERAVARKLACWHSLDDLADKMLARALSGHKVVLSPGAAEVVARVLKGRDGENNV